ncbi:trypsin-like peptidase domain-containing protein [Donghicola mangrovi]|uniref:PDZ domain-containing protein n=1 Tax=Donghicola mangrovi TaxID=2729614 RepID=A0A850Q5T0_9RHOB|nr:trypsin-like peptidase domain-containing protein [Donghicola mangrovi]NVO21915.1 PDZ domain-containing protein [Donghicola mangrovi]
MQVPASQAQISMGFTPVVEQSAPAVVNIYAKRVVAEQVSPFMNDPFFGSIFRGQGQVRQRVQNSLGSGVILSGDGIVVSNFHVVGDATEIRVVLRDRREFNAKVLLADEEADLAIMQLDGAADLPHLDLRNSDEVAVGELVLAIGNPFGVGQTVSSGIVSGLARSGVGGDGGRGYFLQTDAPINPGNSGGALVDINGRLIGVNTSILTRSGGSNGIGFAIPANLVERFVEQAREGQTTFQRPWAGVTGQAVDFDMAGGLGLSVPEGVILSSIHAESPFAEAGFEAGDIVVAVDDQPVNTPQEMVFRMSVAGIGEKAQVTRLRDGQRETLAVQMIAPPDRPAREETTLSRRVVLAGMTVANVNPAVIAEMDLPLDASGVVITDAGPIAPRLGLQTGDILLGINGADIREPKDAESALRDAGRSGIIEVLRAGRRMAFRFRV